MQSCMRVKAFIDYFTVTKHTFFGHFSYSVLLWGWCWGIWIHSYCINCSRDCWLSKVCLLRWRLFHIWFRHCVKKCFDFLNHPVNFLNVCFVIILIFIPSDIFVINIGLKKSLPSEIHVFLYYWYNWSVSVFFVKVLDFLGFLVVISLQPLLSLL